MSFLRINNVIITIFIAISSLLLNAYDYPKTKVEREMDEMGSVLGDDALIFRPRKVKSNATKSKIGNVNKYLFEAALEILKFTNITNKDTDVGIILTDWYSNQDDKTVKFKFSVSISGDVISSEGIEVKIFEKKLKKGNWSEAKLNRIMSSDFEDKIIRMARKLYIEEKNK